jgi:acyl dehydratase
VNEAGPQRVFADLDELARSVGEVLGTSPWHEITQEQVDTFAQATGDHQWIHVDVERAAVGPFGGTIAHGFLSLSLIPVLQHEIYGVDKVAMGINYGLDHVRFPSPVPVGSRVRGTSTLIAADETSQGVRITNRMVIEREGGAKPVCVADAIALYIRG